MSTAKADENKRPKTVYIGQSVTRLEDLPLVTGAAHFVADMNFGHQLYARIVRSAYASGRIESISVEAALVAPGVVAIWTSSDISIRNIPFRATSIEGLGPFTQPVLAENVVRYVGEPVAIIIADDPYLAEDAADLVEVNIDPVPAYLDARLAPPKFSDLLLCEPTVIKKGYGDVDDAFRRAYEIVELELNIGRHSAIPMETRGALVHYDSARDVLQFFGAAKKPHWNRDQLAEMLGISPTRLELIEKHVGGGFGVRGELYPEDVLVAYASLRLKRTIKWIEDRREHLVATNQSREQWHRIKAAVDRDGRILAIDELLFHDQGAYVRTHGARVADMTIGLLLGPYVIPNYRAAAHFRLTNKTPAATYRAPGRFEGSFVRERLIEAIGVRLGLDPIEVRRRNFIQPEQMPFKRGLTAIETEVVLDSGDYELLLNKALEFSKFAEMKAEAKARRQAGECVGVGFGMFVEKSGLGPSDMVSLSVHTDGIVELITGASSLGQGMETALAQICADTLGINYRNVRVIHGDTSKIPFGFGAHASRVTVMTGEATRRAAETTRTKALEFAAHLLQCNAEDLQLDQGKIFIRDASEPSLTLGDIVAKLSPTSEFRGDREPGLATTAWYHQSHMNYPYGAHMALVRVDKQTGGTKVEKYAIAYDVGRAVNPAMIEGQIVGGLAQGLGGALLEEFLYDKEGQPLSVTFADYLITTCHEMPAVDVLITEDAPSPLNPLGIKGAGEGGVNAAGATIASAIDDALQMPGLVDRVPASPQYLLARISSWEVGRVDASVAR